MLMEELLAKPEEDREFGVVAVRERHLGASTVASVTDHALDDLYPVGVTAVIRQAEKLEDGRYDIITIGGRRFQIQSVDRSEPLLKAQVSFLPEPEIDTQDASVRRLVFRAVGAFEKYRVALGGRLQEELESDEQVPTDPGVLSYLITAALVVDAAQRQELLASPDALTRLAEGIRILSAETAMISTLGAVPAVDLLQPNPSVN
jgi:Lon protease-like protein